jgi:hypothetical protein
MLLGLVNMDAVPHLVPLPDERGKLDFKIQLLARTLDGTSAVDELASWSDDGRVRDDD